MSWINNVIQKLSGGFFSIGSMINVSAGGIVTERDKFFTEQGVSRIYSVDAMKYEYADSVISQISKRVSKLNSNLRLKAYLEVQNAYIPINSPQYVGRMNRALARYLELKGEWDKLAPELRESGLFHDNGVRRFQFTKKTIDTFRHRSESFVDVNNHIRNNDGVFFLVTLFITVVYTDLDQSVSLHSQVGSIIRDEVGKVSEIDKAVATVLSNFSPAVIDRKEARINQFLASESNLTHLLPYKQEGILSTSGIPMGVNVHNNTPLWLDLFSKPEGSSTIICAKAGKGKTFLGFVYTLQLVGAGNTVVYIDLKGTEVSQCLSNAMDSILTLDFSERSTAFINTMFISKDIPDYTMEDAIQATAEMLSIFVNLKSEEGNVVDMMSILRSAVRSYYNEAGVVSGVLDTYHNSEKMNYTNLLKYIGTQRDDDEGKEASQSKMFDMLTRRLTEAVMTHRLGDNENAVKLDALFGYSVIVFAFNKNTDVTVSIIDQVRIYMSMMVTKRLAKYNKQLDLFTCMMAEEGQRYVELPMLCKGLSDLASGSRSDNLNVTVLMNDLNVMQKPELSSLASNIANFLVGSCDEKAVDILKNVFGKGQLAEDVQDIIKSPKKYERTFAVHFEIGSTSINTFVRCDVPPEVADMFKTRSVMDESA